MARLSSKDLLDTVVYYSKEQERIEEARISVLQSPLPEAVKDDRDVDFKRQLDELTKKKVEALKQFCEFPPVHDRHKDKLVEFHQNSEFDDCVFIITKFPDPQSNDEIDTQLQGVIDMVCAAVRLCNYVPRIASERRYHALLWDNVELYLLGCKRAVAIVEDKYRPELNPNVAMEWGWMRGMGRDVLYLIEEEFVHDRADWAGLLEDRFCWSDPHDQICAAVRQWLGDEAEP